MVDYHLSILPTSTYIPPPWRYTTHSGCVFFLIFIVQKVSNIHFVTKDFKIVPLTNLLKLFLAARVIGGVGVCLVSFILMQQ